MIRHDFLENDDCRDPKGEEVSLPESVLLAE